MRIVLFAQAAFGEKVLEKLINRKDDVVGLYTPPDAPGTKNPLTDLAQNAGIPVFQHKRMKDPAVFEEYKKLAPDLNLLAFVTDIIPLSILNFPKHGSIQYHPSILPSHRGKSAINWALIQGEKRTGLSIFWVDEGIDTGPILLQKEVEIGPEETTGSLYFNQLFPLGVDALIEALDLVKAGNAPKIVQNESHATYEPPCDEQDARIEWSQSAEEIHNRIRGCDPQPGAYTLCNGKRLGVYTTKLLSRNPDAGKAQPGEILDVGTEGLMVAARGGALLIQKVRPQGGGKMAASEFAMQAGLVKGQRLGS
jgi:methionyl-tRNA formyltransferase